MAHGPDLAVDAVTRSRVQFRNCAYHTFAPCSPAMTAFSKLLVNASAPSIERGEKLARDGAVTIVSSNDDSVSARVQGTSRYRVELQSVGVGTWLCTCMAAADGSFCKHCVAVVCVLGTDDPERVSEPADLEGELVDAYIRSLDLEAMNQLMSSLAASDERVRQRLVGMATAATSESIDVRDWKKRVTAAFRGSGGFIEWRHAAGWASGVHDMLEVLWSLLGAGHATEVAALAEHAHKRNESAVNRVDDSGGEITEIMSVIADLHLAAAEAGAYRPKKLGKRLAELELKAELDTFHRSAVTYAEVLGDDGLAAYGAVVRKTHEQSPAVESRWGAGFRLRNARAAHALASGDVDALIEVLSEDSMSVRDYVEVVELLVEHDRHDEAVDWADEGLTERERSLDIGKLRDLRASLTLQTGGGADDVEALYWDSFAARPSGKSVSTLLSNAIDPSVTRERVVDWVDELVASAPVPLNNDGFYQVGQSQEPLGSVGALPASSTWHETKSVISMIDVLLELDELDRAANVAMTFGGHRNHWEELTKRRMHEHPLERIDWAFAQANMEIDRKQGKHYRRAVRLLKDVHALLCGDPSSAASKYFDERVAALVAQYPNRPSFQTEFTKAGWVQQ